MRRKREIFTLSFLDIMACSFGAILLIILISNFNDFEEPDLSALNEFRKNEQIKNIYTALGVRLGTEEDERALNLEKLRYH